jgi:hypothetical protein
MAGDPSELSSVNNVSSSDEDEDDDASPKRYNHQTLRAQYSEGSKHMPVSFPPLDPRVNRELFAAQNLPFPYDNAAAAATTTGTTTHDAEDSDSEAESAGSDALDSQDDDDDNSDAEGGAAAATGGLGFNRPYGAGYGPITGVGSSMNHVVGLGWSPSGLGVNRRPVLAVLTGSGTLGMYGEGGGG